jgi:hypothetical protein
MKNKLNWMPEGVCSDASCKGSLCAGAVCPPIFINSSALGSSCQDKGETTKIQSSGSNFILAKCTDTAVKAYHWQDHVECCIVDCPKNTCVFKVGSSCSGKGEVCRSGNYLVACKPTTASQVQFAQPSFPVTQVPAITGAVSFDDITNSKATQFAIVLIASLGIFIITLLNIVHKEK